jgi:hypothetical protein
MMEQGSAPGHEEAKGTDTPIPTPATKAVKPPRAPQVVLRQATLEKTVVKLSAL